METEPTNVERKPKKSVKCEFEGRKNAFKNANALRDHRSAKHAKPQPKKQAPTEPNQTTVTSVSKKQKRTCNFTDCKAPFEKFTAPQLHGLKNHPIPLRCPYTKECLNSAERYLGMSDLRDHIIFQHGGAFTPNTCPIVTCRSQAHRSTWLDALHHIVQSHTAYLLE